MEWWQRVDGEPFVTKRATLREACRAIGRNPAELEVSSFTLVIVSPDDYDAREVAEQVREINGGISADEVRARYVLGTPDQVVTGWRQLVEWGANHLIVSHGAYPSSRWADETLELFGREVLPALHCAGKRVRRLTPWRLRSGRRGPRLRTLPRLVP